MTPQASNSFVIRLWREAQEPEPPQPEWRGRLDHVQSGRHVYFRGIGEIPRLIQSCLDRAAARPTNRPD